MTSERRAFAIRYWTSFAIGVVAGWFLGKLI